MSVLPHIKFLGGGMSGTSNHVNSTIKIIAKGFYEVCRSMRLIWKKYPITTIKLKINFMGGEAGGTRSHNNSTITISSTK